MLEEVMWEVKELVPPPPPHPPPTRLLRSILE